MSDPKQLVSFGTSGHRGSSLHGTFTEAHILAITQAICDYRRAQGTDGPLYMGKDTHALSAPAQRTALEVLAANGVETIIQRERRRHADAGHLARHSASTIAAARITSPTASSSRRRTIRRRTAASSTTRPTAVPPTPMSPAGSRTARTNCSRSRNAGVKRMPFETAFKAGDHASGRFRSPLRSGSQKRRGHGRHSRRPASSWASIRLAALPLPYWEPINSIYRLNIARRESESSTRPSRS